MMTESPHGALEFAAAAADLVDPFRACRNGLDVLRKGIRL
jgi:hypothetical protein